MHTVLVNRWYPPHSGYGGVAMYNYYLAHALAKLGQRVSVVASRQSKTVPALEQDGAVTVHRLLVREHYFLTRVPLLGRYTRPLLQYTYSRQLRQFLNQLAETDPFDILEFAEINAEAFHYLRQEQRLPVVVRCHTPTYVLRQYHTPAEMPYDTGWTERMEKDCILKADALSAPSHDMANTIASALGIDSERFCVIPNPLDTHLFAPPESQPEKNPGKNVSQLTILHVGRLDRVKGIEVLAQAVPQVLRQFPQVRFAFVGEDRPDGQGSTWRQRLESQFESRRVGGQVELRGSVDLPALVRAYHQADIAVVPTLNYESFSYTCAQAMAAGLPLVASRIGGIPETVGEAGVLVQPGDAGELAQALVSLARDAGRRASLGLAARERARQYFDSGVVAQATLDFYRQVCA